MRNTILVLGTVTLLTFATPALATGACSLTSPVSIIARSMGSMTIRQHTDRPIRCAESPIKCRPGTLGMPEVTTPAIGPMDS